MFRTLRFDPLFGAIANLDGKDIQEYLRKTGQKINSAMEKEISAKPVTVKFRPAMDVVEYGDRFVIELDVYGASKESIKLSVDGSVVKLTGKSLDLDETIITDAQANEGRILLRERRNYVFEREFDVGVDIDNVTTTAKFDNGRLTITLPKKQIEEKTEIKID